LRVNYKPFPVSPNPAFPSLDTVWRPILNVVIFYQHRRSNRIECVVDSGSPWCFFRGDVGDSLGMDVRNGVEEPLGGVIGGAQGRVYYHKIRIWLLVNP